MALINLSEQPENVRLTLWPTEQKVIIESLAKELTIEPIEITLRTLFALRGERKRGKSTDQSPTRFAILESLKAGSTIDAASFANG